MEKFLVIAYDIGTTSVKTCLFNISGEVMLVVSSGAIYPIKVLDNGGVEQDASDWWAAMCETTKDMISAAAINPSEVAGISFCSQMQSLVLMDKAGQPVRPAMSYMDQRAGEQLAVGMKRGLQIAGANIFRLLRALSVTRAAPLSVKDPVWKYLWVKQNEPEAFARVYKWLDVKEALICRCTGNFVMTRDSAYATLLYDTRRGRERFSREMCRMLGVNEAHLPHVINSTDKAGELTAKAAAELGLVEGTPVFGGGGDASLIGVGAGATAPGETHVYIGTSGWVSTVVEKQLVDTSSMIASIIGAGRHFHYFAEMETAGKCLEWVRDHLALDEIGIYLKNSPTAESPEEISHSLYDYMMSSISGVPPGSRKVLFAPWLHGNRCPFEDPMVRGVFFNIGIETGKRDMIRAVLEGVCFHIRWMLEAQSRKVPPHDTIRFVGGGALSPTTCQILADITGRTVETVAEPQNAGAVGAAIVAAVGLGALPSVESAGEMIPASARYTPNVSFRDVYDRAFKVFKMLYRNNKKLFALLNAKDRDRDNFPK